MKESLDIRARALLKTLIERYIVDGQPVGSRTLSKFSGLDLSPATIRNVMSDLEELGLVASPHTSAGRIPTPRGYRLFVDSLLTVQPIESAARHQIKDQIHPDQPQRVLATAAQVLSELSQFAGVVLTPKRANQFRHIEFLRLSDHRILLIVVSPEGDVQNRLILTEQSFTASELIEAANFLNQHYSGQALDDVRGRLRSELVSLRSDMAGLMAQAIDAGSEALGQTGETVVISGERNLLEVSELSDDMGRLRRLFDMFAKKTQLMRLLDASLRADGVQIYIGGESQLVPFEELTIITAPYEVKGEIVGTLGVIGPTRMDYERVIPIVDITSRLVSNALSRDY